MSSSLTSTVPPSAVNSAANPSDPSAPSTDGRIRVLCPKGIDPQAAWPGGGKPLMAYIVYAPLALAPNPTSLS